MEIWCKRPSQALTLWDASEPCEPAAPMLPLTKEQEASFGLELATKRQEHADLDAAISTLVASGLGDQMLIQRLKKRKLVLKDRIVQLENLLLPDIIA